MRSALRRTKAVHGPVVPSGGVDERSGSGTDLRLDRRRLEKRRSRYAESEFGTSCIDIDDLDGLIVRHEDIKGS